MADLIRAFALWTRLLFVPRSRTARSADWPRVRASRPGPALPAWRSPYGLDGGPLDGDEARLVRPYQRAHEQRQRRLALVLAADFGIDLDTYLIGARSRWVA
ncbi:hypothetical protein ACFTWH_11800 [Streptomyces sp. NPDC057011]|uniref:hypothetical protein n=1 Tax=unclassified Streptomyces TaxID=2593676 RepID=UPI00362F16A6